MMTCKTLLGALVALSLSGAASATPLLYTQTFEGSTSGIHFSISFTADDTDPTTVTSLSGTAGSDPLAIISAGDFYSNNNVFHPSTLSSTGSRGWGSPGLSFRDTITGINFAMFDYNELNPRLDNSSSGFFTEFAINFQTSTGSQTTVDEPGMLALLAIGGLGLGFRRQSGASRVTENERPTIKATRAVSPAGLMA